ncbi:hypothetical protein [Pseudomonas sp. RC2C2]|uniref:nSTAND3 domain-containing NTPase n=1 Tax=Pseudomonas sp. RC2C2 TaxID=2834408 RepID=UPI001BCF34B4|nr:hypothetical protein [Pseudomonas sp. RC2C2]MBS7596904.1 hypothetical protein [Pseudomonas sp. RC2C2]
MSSMGSIRGAAAAQLGFDYQLDVSILAALQLLLISKAATRLVLEPANEEDLEADLEPQVPGRMQSSAMIAGAYKLVVQVKRNTGEPWSINDFRSLLTHGSDKAGGRRKALHHLDDLNTRYLLVTTSGVKGVARGLLVNGFEETPDKGEFPSSLTDILQTSPEGRVAIWADLTEKQLASDMRELMTDLLHVPRPKQEGLLAKLRLEAKRRTRGTEPGIWTREDLLTTVRAYGGFLSSNASLEHFVPPNNFHEMDKQLTDKGAIVIRGPSGSGKTQAALKLCELAREREGSLEVVVLGADDTPSSARKLIDCGPTLFYIEDPWGQYRLRDGADSWTDQLPRLLAKASPAHQFVITSRTDMMRKAQEVLNQWSVELDSSEYLGGQLRQMYDNRMDQLPPALQTKAHDFRREVLSELETPLEIDIYFQQLAQGAEEGEEDHAFSRRLLQQAHRDAVEGVVVSTLEVSDTVGIAAIVWALLAARRQIDRSKLGPLKRTLRPLDRHLSEGLDKLIDRMVASCHLRQPSRTISFAHPSARQGFEVFVMREWLGSEEAIQSLISALTQLSDEHRAWGMETAARVFEATRRFAEHSDVDVPFKIDPSSQVAIDAWLDEGLLDPASDFSALLALASEVGSTASIPSRIAYWLLNGTQRGASAFIDDWQPPVFDDAWYSLVFADPRSRLVATRFIREELGLDRESYGIRFVERLDRIAVDLTSAYLDAARQMVGKGYEENAIVVATGAIRDLEGYEVIVNSALDNLTAIQLGYDQSYAEEWRAIEDGERDAVAEEAMQSYHEDDGYASGVFVDVYVRHLRCAGQWKVLAEHSRMAELVGPWARDLRKNKNPGSQAEISAIVTCAKGLDAEPEVWEALGRHWLPEIEQALEMRIADRVASLPLRNALTETALAHAPSLMVNEIKSLYAKPSQQLILLADVERASSQIDVEDRVAARHQVTEHLSPELVEIIEAFRSVHCGPTGVSATALKILIDSAFELDLETLAVTVPVIVASGGDASRQVAFWLKSAKGKEDALAATKAAIEIGDTALVELALRHNRADARHAALLDLASSYSDTLPAFLLALSADPSAKVRRALVSVISERPHVDHLETLMELMGDQWSSADIHTAELETYSIAREAVIALANSGPLADPIGDKLLDLANTTRDRTLSQIALTVAANLCSCVIQRKISNLVTLNGARGIRLDALMALADAEKLDSSVTAHLGPNFLMRSPAVMAAHAAHLVGAHADSKVALKIFTSVASVNRRQVLLLVGANAMAARNRKTAEQILDLLESNHPARRILDAPQPLPFSVLDDLGSVALRKYARERLGERISKC